MKEPEIVVTETEVSESKNLVDFISGCVVKATPEEFDAVQVFSKRLVEDFGYPKSYIQTHPQFRVKRTPSEIENSYPVDIAVFSKPVKTDENIFLVVECKKKERKDGIKQLKIYLSMCQAQIGVWYNGQDHAYLWKVYKKEGDIEFRTLPNIPRFGQRIEDIGRFLRKDLIKSANLKSVFKDIRNHLAGHTTGITRDTEFAQEIINILFCKIFDEMNKGPNEIVDFRNGVDEKPEVVKNRILSIFDRRVKAEYNDVFLDSDTITLDAESISYVVGELQNYCITEAERDVIGDSFEVFIGPALRGAEGQFFTPRNVVKTVVDILDPNPEEMIIDPACGSGGFLIVALEHVWKKIAEEGKKRNMPKEWVKERQKTIATKFFRGLDKDNFLTKVTKAYMAIVGDGRGGVFCEDSLQTYSEWKDQTRQKIQSGNFDIVLTNPPFGSKISISGEKRLSQYELGFKWKKDKEKSWVKTNKLQNKQPPQILFIERCLDLLKDGGRLGIVLPDGVMGGEKMGYLPKFILDKAEVLALVDCPIETFCPSTTTKTHLLFLKKKKTVPQNYSIFMAVADKVGHDRKGRAIPTDSFPEISQNYDKLINGKLTKQSNKGYLVENKWLENNLIARRYLPEYIEILRKIEKTKLKKKHLGEIVSVLKTGANVDADHYSNVKDGKPYVLVSSLTDEGLDLSKTKFVDMETYEKFKNARVLQGDIITNRCGEVGISAIVPSDFAGALPCGFVFVIRLRKEYDPYYVTSFLNSEIGKKQLQRLAMGTTLDHITKHDLEGITVLFLSEPEMKKISSTMREAIEQRVKSRKFLSQNKDLFIGSL